jgi:hypothetical protein
VHLLRELTYFEELTSETKAWAAPLKELLLEMKGVAEGEGAQVPTRLVGGLTGRYDRLAAEGQEAQPPPDIPPLAWRQACSLLRRLERRKREVLRFLSDPAVPFDRYERRRSRAHSPGPTEPHSFGFGGLLRLAGWPTASAHHARQLVPTCRRSSRALVELGAARACDH